MRILTMFGVGVGYFLGSIFFYFIEDIFYKIRMKKFKGAEDNTTGIYIKK